MLWLCAAITDGGAPMMLVIDDGHWADRPSLEVISYLARRVSDVPMLIVLAFRPDVPGAASDLLTLIGDGRFTSSLTLRPLTAGGSAELMRRSAPAASIEVCRRCHDAAHGNPWLVGELGHQIASHGPGSLNFPAGPETPVRALARDVDRPPPRSAVTTATAPSARPWQCSANVSSPMWWRPSPECRSMM